MREPEVNVAACLLLLMVILLLRMRMLMLVMVMLWLKLSTVVAVVRAAPHVADTPPGQHLSQGHVD